MGSSNAITNLNQARALWHARHLIGEYLRPGDPGTHGEILAALTGLEGVAIADLEHLIPLLPPWVETPGLQSGQITVLQTVEPVTGWGAEEPGSAAASKGFVKYAVVLPAGVHAQPQLPGVAGVASGGVDAGNRRGFLGSGP